MRFELSFRHKKRSLKIIALSLKIQSAYPLTHDHNNGIIQIEIPGKFAGGQKWNLPQIIE